MNHKLIQLRNVFESLRDHLSIRDQLKLRGTCTLFQDAIGFEYEKKLLNYLLNPKREDYVSDLAFSIASRKMANAAEGLILLIKAAQFETFDREQFNKINTRENLAYLGTTALRWDEENYDHLYQLVSFVNEQYGIEDNFL